MEKSRNIETVQTVDASIMWGELDRLTSTEQSLAEVLAGIMSTDSVAAHSNFFDDLGADSMVMARFCARVRKRDDLPSISMKDIYAHPTIAGLAAAFGEPEPEPEVVRFAAPLPAEPAHRATQTAYVVCGILQLVSFLAYCAVYGVVTYQGYEWISGSSSVLEIYLRSVTFGGGGFIALCLLPIAAKWLLIGRWTATEIPVWSLAYFRFWLVKLLIRSNPLVLFVVGSPLYPLYLRMLGAKVGRDVTILTKTVPVCTDLLSIGDSTVIRKDAHITCYRARGGMIQLGPVDLGAHVVVAEKTVLDIGTAMGDHAQLGHASSLQTGQSVPAGEHWHGSPALRTEVDYSLVPEIESNPSLRAGYAVMQIVSVVLVTLPLLVGGVAMLLRGFPPLAALLDSESVALTGWAFYRDALLASLAIVFGIAILGLIAVTTVPKVLNRFIEPDRIYPIYGFHYSVHRTITRMTNVKFFTYLFGDSSYIVNYLSALGYDLSKAEQTGSNFGSGVAHETPFLATVGRGTMVADGLSIINADYSANSFRVSRATIGAHSFLGNHIAYPAQGRTGENVLLATKVMVPIDGPIRENVGLLGSPSFEIPRSVQRDSRLDPVDDADLQRRLSAKNKHNIVSMGLALFVRWVHVVGITMLSMVAAHFLRNFGAESVAAEILVAMLFTMTYFVFVERAVAGFRPLEPQFCSIYDRYFWSHERYWKLVIPQFDKLLSGTPFKNVLNRLLGVQIGKRVYDDGCFMPERTLVAVGDDCMLNELSIIQSHSQEDGSFKSDRSVLGARCTVGPGALVHYGVTMGDDVILEADSFLMKGEDVPSNARWAGNPARDISQTPRSIVSTAPAAALTWSSAPTAAIAASAGMTS